MPSIPASNRSDRSRLRSDWESRTRVMRAVNLLPGDVTKEKSSRWNPPLITGIVVGFVVLSVLAVGFVRESARVSHKRTELQAARAELALIPAPSVPDPASTTLLS